MTLKKIVQYPCFCRIYLLKSCLIQVRGCDVAFTRFLFLRKERYGERKQKGSQFRLNPAAQHIFIRMFFVPMLVQFTRIQLFCQYRFVWALLASRPDTWSHIRVLHMQCVCVCVCIIGMYDWHIQTYMYMHMYVHINIVCVPWLAFVMRLRLYFICIYVRTTRACICNHISSIKPLRLFFTVFPTARAVILQSFTSFVLSLRWPWVTNLNLILQNPSRHGQVKRRGGSTSKHFQFHIQSCTWHPNIPLRNPAKMAEKWPRFGALLGYRTMVKLGAGVDNELGGSGPHQCR